MKRKIACLMACLMLLTGGCDKSPVSGGADIRLSAGVTPMALQAGPGDELAIRIAGWESRAAADYTAEPKWKADAVIRVSQTASQVEMSPVQTYHQDETVKTFMKAWNPGGTLAGGKVTFSGAPDGTVDVLLAAEVSGSARDNASKALVFKHLLTQVRFAVMGDESFGSATRLRSISVKGAQLPSGIDLTGDAVLYSAPGDVAVTGMDGTQFITADATAAGNPVMMGPFAGNTFLVDVTTSQATYRDVVVTVDKDPSLKPGKAYTITLRFSAREITVNAAITDWIPGFGSGTVQ